MTATLPDWAHWRSAARPAASYTLGVEEEVMLLDPGNWALAARIDDVLPLLPEHLLAHMTAETHGSALELATGVHGTVSEAATELHGLRNELVAALEPFDLRAAVAGVHPFAVWQDTVISEGERYQFLYGSMRELARREPTFALHVHVGVTDPQDAVRLARQLRAHLPLLLALSVNSPFWQGRDTGLSSARTPLFQAFPRVGIPRAFSSYEEYVEAIDLLIRCGALPDPTFLWWDVRLQPRFGTVEIRICDAQTAVRDTAAIVALIQSISRLELEEGFAHPALVHAPEVLSENRFLAARDGMDAALVVPQLSTRVPALELVEELVAACRPHAEVLGCSTELEGVRVLAVTPGARRQLNLAQRGDKLQGLVRALSDAFLD